MLPPALLLPFRYSIKIVKSSGGFEVLLDGEPVMDDELLELLEPRLSDYSITRVGIYKRLKKKGSNVLKLRISILQELATKMDAEEFMKLVELLLRHRKAGRFRRFLRILYGLLKSGIEVSEAIERAMRFL